MLAVLVAQNARESSTAGYDDLEPLGTQDGIGHMVREALGVLRYAIQLEKHSFDFTVFLENHALAPPR